MKQLTDREAFQRLLAGEECVDLNGRKYKFIDDTLHYFPAYAGEYTRFIPVESDSQQPTKPLFVSSAGAPPERLTFEEAVASILSGRNVKIIGPSNRVEPLGFVILIRRQDCRLTNLVLLEMAHRHGWPIYAEVQK
jgi:hypothetical protein